MNESNVKTLKKAIVLIEEEVARQRKYQGAASANLNAALIYLDEIKEVMEANV